jgi:hypothetical protein
MSLVKYNKEEKNRILNAYIRGAISEQEFERIYPSENEDRKQIVKNVLNKQYSFKEALLGDSLANKSYRFIVTTLIANQSWIMNNYIFKMFSLSASATEIIPIDKFAKKFKLSNNMKLTLRLILMTMMTNYMYAFQSAATVAITKIPNLTLIFKNLIKKIIEILVNEYAWQSNNIKGLTPLQKANIGKDLAYAFIDLVNVVIDKAQSLTLDRMKFLGYDIDVDKVIEIIDNDEGTLTLAHTSLKILKNKKEDGTRLLTDDDIKEINDGMLKLVPIATDLAIIDESSSLLNSTAISSSINIVKTAFSGLMDASNTLENIKNENYGSKLTNILEDKLYILEPSLRKNLNLRHFRHTGNDINRAIESAVDELHIWADETKYEAVEAYNYQSSYFGLINPPEIYNIGQIEPPNPERATVKISVDMLTPIFPLIFLFTFIYYFYSGIKKVYRYWKPSNEENNIEVLPDQRIRRRKSKSTRSKRRN